MDVRSFKAPTMAAALAEVKKHLGPEAVIVSTRSLRVGGVLGVGARTIIEINAAAPVRPPAAAQRAATARYAAERVAPDSGPFAAAPVPGSRAVPTPGPRERPSAAVASDAARLVLERAAARIPAAVTPAPTPSKAPMPMPASLTATVAALPPVPAPAAGKAAPAAPLPAVVPAPVPVAVSTLADRRQRLDADITAAVRTQAAASVDLEAEIADLRRMMSQVLEATRSPGSASQGWPIGSPGMMPATGRVPPAETAGGLAGPLGRYAGAMRASGAPASWVDALTSDARRELSSAELDDAGVVRETLVRLAAERLSVAPTRVAPATGRRPRVIALLGPTGAGKTTTVAKLAASLHLREGRRVGLLTADTYRIAAIEQLRTYAGIIGLPLQVAASADDARRALAEFAGCDAVLVDTPGRGQRDAARIGELAALLDALRPDERHLVLPATASEDTMARIVRGFAAARPDRVLLSKLDESAGGGAIAAASAAAGRPFSFITLGQEVPDDIAPARADRLARWIVQGLPAEGPLTGGEA